MPAVRLFCPECFAQRRMSRLTYHARCLWWACHLHGPQVPGEFLYRMMTAGGPA